MKEQAEKLKARTHAFFVRVIELCDALDERPAARSIARQLVDAAGGTDSNYRAACRARTKKEFIAKMGVAIEEADECLGWLNALRAANLGDSALVASLAGEADELTRIFVKSRQTAQTNLAREELAKASRRHNKREAPPDP